MKNKNLKILLVEDSETDTKIVKDLLEQEHKFPTIFTKPEIEHVKCLNDALEEINNNTFDVVLLDLGLPDSKGLDTFNKIRNKFKSMPIIILTSSVVEREELRQCLDGVQSYLVKDHLDSDSLIASICKVIGGITEPPQEHNMKNKDLTILLVEDSTSDAAIVQGMLAQSHPKDKEVKVEHVTSLYKAIEKISEHNFDTILLDLNLPDSDGINTFIRISKKAGNMPVILLTGLNDQETAIKLIQEGAQDYLIKDNLTSRKLIESILYTIERCAKSKKEITQVSLLSLCQFFIFIALLIIAAIWILKKS